ncbi:MAG: transposase [Dictyoglomus thermophilum]|uniref:Transposase IS4-like domain-containing protein n=1 Tax=Dictyoglomus thermophilum TaxID=14 RepID=A0A7C2CSZ8_DICTH|nr:transposase [Dictyoglomus thermophilum]MCX7720672.1 transposase [Dictyoglomus thermophilum]TYT24187.1 transposase [Dictyoglomus thermophilum]
MRKGRRIILGVEGGKAYTSYKFKGFYFIGDKGYDSIEIIREIKERGFKPVIKIKETFRVGVKDELRKEAKRYSMREDLCKKRKL